MAMEIDEAVIRVDNHAEIDEVEPIEISDDEARRVRLYENFYQVNAIDPALYAQHDVKRGLRNALIPVVTMMGLQFGFLLGGSIVVEKVFNWPGLGRLLVDAVEMRDYPVLQAEVLLFSLEFILINLLVDILYAVINPRICFK